MILFCYLLIFFIISACLDVDVCSDIRAVLRRQWEKKTAGRLCHKFLIMSGFSDLGTLPRNAVLSANEADAYGRKELCPPIPQALTQKSPFSRGLPNCLSVLTLGSKHPLVPFNICHSVLFSMSFGSWFRWNCFLCFLYLVNFSNYKVNRKNRYSSTTWDLLFCKIYMAISKRICTGDDDHVFSQTLSSIHIWYFLWYLIWSLFFTLTCIVWVDFSFLEMWGFICLRSIFARETFTCRMFFPYVLKAGNRF